MSEVPQIPLQATPSSPKPNRRTAEEDRAWAQLYASIGQPSTAEEVVRQLDADAPARHDHLALYLRARTTLRERKVTEARNQRIAAFARTVIATVVIGPWRALRWLMSSGSDVAVEMLPPVRKDPAKPRVRALMTSDPEFATAAERFAASAEGTTAAAGPHEPSRGAKAA